MQIDVAFLPREVEQEGLTRRCAVVFDVLRATTSMTAALAAGAREIRIFPSVSAARNAAAAPGMEDRPLLCGEEKCLAPAGFDLGNSPGAFAAKVNGKTLLMSTTNGTKAILAAGGAKLLLVGALVNASAVAAAIAASGLDVTMICAGTDGKIAIEDVIGAGAVIDALERFAAGNQLIDSARIARRLFTASKDDLRSAIASGAGGQNVIRNGLEPDIDFAAALDRFADVVGVVEGTTVRLHKLMPSMGDRMAKGYQVIEVEELDELIHLSDFEIVMAVYGWLLEQLKHMLSEPLKGIEVEIIPVTYYGTYPAIGVRYPDGMKVDVESLIKNTASDILRSTPVLEFLDVVSNSKISWRHQAKRLIVDKVGFTALDKR